MSVQFLKKVANSFDSIAFSSGLFMSVLFACSKQPALTQVPQPIPGPVPGETSKTSAPATAQGNGITPALSNTNSKPQNQAKATSGLQRR